MKIYSDFPLQRTLQIAADVAAIVAIALGIWLGTLVSSTIGVLANVGRQLEDTGTGFKNAMADAGEALGTVPFVGETVRVPFDAASDTGGVLADAGQSTQAFIMTAATVVGIVVAGVIAVTVCWVWLRRRIRFAVRARRAARIASMPEGENILALRALMGGSRKDLAAVGPSPVTGWRAGHPDIVARLATLELRAAGVRLAR